MIQLLELFGVVENLFKLVENLGSVATRTNNEQVFDKLSTGFGKIVENLFKTNLNY